MSHKQLAALIAIGVVALFVLFIIVRSVRRRRGRNLSVEYFTQRWKDLQKNCMTRKTWPLAVTEADELLDEALRKKRYKGKTPGERLVSAQHDLTNNESVWLGHKLRKQMPDVDVRKLRKQDVFEALSGFREALRDLGALEKPKNE